MSEQFLEEGDSKVSREEQKRERRNKIIAVAKKHFLLNGMQNVQLQDIAKDAGVGIATLYRYFPNKDQLIIAVNNNIMQEMTNTIDQIVNESSTAFEQLDRLLTYYMDLADEPAHQFVKFFKTFEIYKDEVLNDSENYQTFLHIRRNFADVLLQLVKNGQQDGSLRNDLDLEVFVFTAVQNVSYFVSEAVLVEHDPTLTVDLNPKKQLQLLKDMFLQYVRP